MNTTIKLFQKLVFHAVNRTNPKRKPEQTTLSDGRILLNDIRYGSTYPNSFLDIYLSPVEMERHPTFLYVHGGGYTWGSKEDYHVSEPDKGLGVFFHDLCCLGYHIVSVDYAFAPEHRYPTPILQLSEAVSFLSDHTELGIDLNRVAFGGDSAGGQLIGQFINLQVNEDYAREMNIPSVLSKGSILAAVFFSGLLDLERFGVTHFKITDSLFSKCGYAYFNTRILTGNPRCIQGSVISHATEDFPPSFISDGNNGTFYDQASDFAKRLTELGVKNELVLYPADEAKLGHGYETADSPQAQETKKRAICFLQGLL